VLDNFCEDEVDNSKWLKERVDSMRYPPKIIVDIYYLKEQTRDEGHGFTLQVTGLRGDHDRNTSLEIFVHSGMYREQTCEYNSFEFFIRSLFKCMKLHNSNGCIMHNKLSGEK